MRLTNFIVLPLVFVLASCQHNHAMWLGLEAPPTATLAIGQEPSTLHLLQHPVNMRSGFASEIDHENRLRNYLAQGVWPNHNMNPADCPHSIMSPRDPRTFNNQGIDDGEDDDDWQDQIFDLKMKDFIHCGVSPENNLNPGHCRRHEKAFPLPAPVHTAAPQTSQAATAQHMPQQPASQPNPPQLEPQSDSYKHDELRAISYYREGAPQIVITQEQEAPPHVLPIIDAENMPYRVVIPNGYTPESAPLQQQQQQQQPMLPFKLLSAGAKSKSMDIASPKEAIPSCLSCVECKHDRYQLSMQKIANATRR